MKPFQFYTVGRFESLSVGTSTSTSYQMTFSGEGEDVQTTFTLTKKDFEGPLDLLRVQSQIKHETFGFIKAIVGSQRQKLEFTEYLEPVDFHAYYASQKKVMIFRAPKKTCKGVVSNIARNECGVKLVEMTVDFAKVLSLVSDYQGAWFRKVSSRVHSAGIHGEQIQDDGLFKKLLKDGELSNVTIPWRIGSAEHRVMLTASGAIVLVQDYKDSISLELRIVMDVYENLLSQVWEVRKSKRDDAQCHGTP